MKKKILWFELILFEKKKQTWLGRDMVQKRLIVASSFIQQLIVLNLLCVASHQIV